MPRPSPQTDRVAALVAHLADHDEGATLTELAGALGQDRSALVHVLASLTTAGVLVREPSDRRYHLGPALVRPGRVAEARYGDLAVVRDEMVRLSEAVGHPCLCFEPVGDHARLAQVVWPPGSEPPALPVGEELPSVPPLGIVFVAWGPDEELERWLARAPELGADRAERFAQQRRAIRDLGFVVEARPPRMEDDEFVRLIDDRTSPRRDGKLLALLADHGRDDHVLTELGDDPAMLHRVHAIGAPCFDATGTSVRSLSVIGFDRPLTTEEVRSIGAATRAAADRATAALGGSPPAVQAATRRRPARRGATIGGPPGGGGAEGKGHHG